MLIARRGAGAVKQTASHVHCASLHFVAIIAAAVIPSFHLVAQATEKFLLKNLRPEQLVERLAAELATEMDYIC